jgi:4-amino-4-deoxy-L-arabinose transferase-like glycosyltransferase
MKTPPLPWWSPAVAGLGLAAFASLCVTVGRSPLVWIDEVYIAAATRSATGVPAISPPLPQNVSYEFLYGPVYFWLGRASFWLFGVSPTGGRAVCVAGALIAALGAAWLAFGTSRTLTWPLFALGAVMLMPDVGLSAANGRMDTLAVAFEVLGLAAFIDSIRRAGRWSTAALSGGCWIAAVLTTTRTFPFEAALVAGLIWLWIRARSIAPPDTAAVRRATVVALATMIALFASRLAWLRVTPLDYLRRMIDATAGAHSVQLVGAMRDWSISPLQVASLVALLPPLVVLVGWRPRQRDRAALIADYLLIVTLLNTALYIAIVNQTFVRSIYFSVPLVAVLVAVTPRALPPRPLRRALAAWAGVVIVAFGAVQSAKLLDVWQTWHARSLDGIDALVRSHVPAGAVVAGDDEFYYYSVERSGARFQAYRPDPGAPYANFPGIRRAWGDHFTDNAPFTPASYFIWPDDPHWPLPDPYRCVSGHSIGRYTPPASTASVLDGVPTFQALAHRRRYPATVLYQLPSGCPSAP